MKDTIISLIDTAHIVGIENAEGLFDCIKNHYENGDTALLMRLCEAAFNTYEDLQTIKNILN